MSLAIHVLGAGVVGLTTAIEVQKAYSDAQVTIIAEIFPGDPKSIKYTSIWAGAHHVSLAGSDPRQQKMDRHTFQTMWEMSAPGSSSEGCFLRLDQTEYYAEERVGENSLSVMPGFRTLEKSELRPGTTSGVNFQTLTIDTPRYLSYLLATFVGRGGDIKRASLQHISQVLDGAYSSPPGQPPSAVITCLGIGAYSLGGVEDKDVYPVRGQTVLIDAPWVRFGRTISSLDGLWTYIIPRKSGGVIIGGVKDEGDWYPHVREEVTEDIMKRALALCPELVSPNHNFNSSPQPTLDDLKARILEVGCGLRPSRKGGIRLEAEVMKTTPRKDVKQVEIPVIHNYGHGGYGYQSSWGSAAMARDLLKSKLTSA